jgi:hypothetical protein
VQELQQGNCLGSMMDSITNFPAPFKTAIEVASL